MKCDVCRTALATECGVFVATAPRNSTRWLCALCTAAVEDYLRRLVDAQKELRPL